MPPPQSGTGLTQALELMTRFIAILFLITAPQASATDTFSERISKARKAELSPVAQPTLVEFMN